MQRSLARFDDPTPEALEAWHAGRGLSGLAESVFDANQALIRINSRAFAATTQPNDPEVSSAVERSRPSLEAEHDWLAAQMQKQITRRQRGATGSLHRLEADELGRRYPTDRSRYALHALLSQEAMGIAQRIADVDFASERKRIEQGGAFQPNLVFS